MTQEFVKEVVAVTNDLEETNNEVIQWKEHKDRFMNMSEKLERERTNGPYRYGHSIEDIIERS